MGKNFNLTALSMMAKKARNNLAKTALCKKIKISVNRIIYQGFM